MALANFELYEALKKDLSEDAARMIAEVIPRGGDLVTNAQLEARLEAMEARLKAYIDSRLLRYTAVILVPIALTMLATAGALVALVLQL